MLEFIEPCELTDPRNSLIGIASVDNALSELTYILIEEFCMSGTSGLEAVSLLSVV